MCSNYVPAKNIYLYIKILLILKNPDFFFSFCFYCKHDVLSWIFDQYWAMENVQMFLTQDSTLSRWARSYRIWTDPFHGVLTGGV